MTTLAAYLAHYPLSAALKAHATGDPLPCWELHPVDVEAARPWADMLHTLRRARPAVAFPGPADTIDGVAFRPGDPMAADFAEGKGFDAPCDKIAAPDERTANAPPVEQPAGEDPPASPAKPLDNSKEYDVDRFGRPILPPADEGNPADPTAITILKTRYAALEGDGRSWVNAVAKQAQAAGGTLSLADSQPQTIRRFEAMRALVLLAEGGFADDQAVRGILRPILGDVADSRLFTVGKLVAALNPDEAARFAALAGQVVDGAAALAITQPDGLYVWEFAA